MNNERASLPSASSAQRYDLCPGSFLLEQHVAEDPTSPDAALGNRVHALLAGEVIMPPPTDAEADLVMSCTRIEDDLVARLFGPQNPTQFTDRERRLWAFDDRLNKAWSGKPDVVWQFNGHALVIDYKTGRGDVESAVGNLQLRALAVLATETYGATTVTVAIIQPMVSGDASVCTYSAADLDMASAQIHALMAAIRKPGQPRRPSLSACKYCKAKTICPEANAVVETLPATVPRDGQKIALTPQEMATFLEKAPLVESIIDAVRAKAKRDLEADPNAIPGWALEPGDIREKVTNPELVFGRFSDSGGTSAQFMAAVTVTKTGLKAATKAATGKKGKELDITVEHLLDGATESKQNAPSLVRVKGGAV